MSLSSYGYNETPSGGTVMSQMGQIMSMVLCQLDDIETIEIINIIKDKYNQVDLKTNKVAKPDSYGLQLEWVISAYQNRLALLKYINYKYPNQDLYVKNIWWDNDKELLEIEPIVKSTSADIYIRLSNDDIIAISLKKNYNVFLVNTSLLKATGIDCASLTDKQFDIYKRFYNDNKDLIEYHLELTDDEFINKQVKSLTTPLLTNNKKNRKLLLTLIQDFNMILYKEKLKNNYAWFVNDIGLEIKYNKEVLNKVLSNICQSLPIQFILDNKEVLFIGDQILDANILKETLGINSYTEFIYQLDIVPKDRFNKLLIKHKDLNLFTLNIRQKGIYYNGSIAMIVQLEKDFFDKIVESNKKII